jgi:hypothetical protein
MYRHGIAGVIALSGGLLLFGYGTGWNSGPTAEAAPVLRRPAVPNASAVFTHKIRPLLRHYCFECHVSDKPKGDLRLDTLEADFESAEPAKAWRAVAEQLASQTMPPKKKRQPAADESRAIRGWVETNLALADARRQKAEGRTVCRRLNRVEYENTINDLLGINADVKGMLPEDTPEAGFDNVASGLRVSAVHIQSYLNAADAALDAFFVGKEPQPKTTKARFSFPEQKSMKEALGKHTLAKGDAVVLFYGDAFSYSPWGDLRDSWARVAGNYRIRFPVQAHQSDGKVVTLCLFAGKHADYFDAPAESPKIIEVTKYLKRNQSLQIVPYRFGYGAKDLTKVRGLVLDWLEMEGPLFDTWPPAGYQRLIDKVDLKKGTLADAESILRAFLPRAFRRPVADAEVRAYVELVDTYLADKASFEEALRAGLKAVLCSPHFLYLVEKPGKLDDFALAARLSYFLCSSMPDDELTRLAGEGSLRKPEVLRQQVERLLQSPRAAAFTQNFLGQWLDLRHIDATTPERRDYPRFDHLLKVSMIQETHLFFEELLKNDLSVRNFIDSDFAMLNRPLADLYGVPDVEGLDIRRVKLPPDSHRGGVLTQASVLKVTANGTSTSPVVRGVWLLTNILGQPPKPPPANVPAVEPDTRGTTTMREQLAQHRKTENCASCHKRIDPLGFALENFDVIGAWRDNYRTSDRSVQKFTEVTTPEGNTYKFRVGAKVDASDEMPDGQWFRDIDELKKILLTNPEPVVRCLTEKLLVYATGSALGDADRPVVDGILQRARGRDYGLRTLIHEVVQSPLFLSK